MVLKNRASHALVLFVIPILLFSLTSCQAVVTSEVPATQPPTLTSTPLSTQTTIPTTNPVPTNNPAAPTGVLWVDAFSDLGSISKYVLGANHSPVGELGAANIDPAKNSGITFLRWPGGNWGDQNNVLPNQIQFYMGVARNIIGAEPSVMVRFLGSTPEQAAALVKYINIDKGYGIKYWSIGNEPDLYAIVDPIWTPDYVAKRWREFALAMKAVDPSIILYGPDISGFVGDADKLAPREYTGVQGINKRDYLTAFLKLNADLVDIVSVHQYAFPNKLSDSLPSWKDLRDDTPVWDRIIPNLHRIIKETIGSDKPVAVTEFNSTATNSAGAATSPDSLYSALWLADVLGRMIRHQPEILTYWDFKDSASGFGLMGSYDLNPSYYVYQLYKQFGNHLLATNSATQYVSVFAAKRDDGSITVILVNLNDNDIHKPLQLKQGDNLKLTEAYVLDKDHKAESISTPAFQNGDEVTLPADSVTLYIFK